MILRGHKFNFSCLNADDADRMLAAKDKTQARAKAEGHRYTPHGDGYSEWLRFQCRVYMDFLDEVLGAGASEMLGLNGSNYGECLKVNQEFNEAIAAEKASAVTMANPAAAQTPAPQNHKQGKKSRPVVNYPERPVPKKAAETIRNAVTPYEHYGTMTPYEKPAVAMVERVDKQARREQLLRELAALDNA